MRKSPTFEYESALWQQGYSLIAGIDEAGRGAWAGPVMAGVVILPTDLSLAEKLTCVMDSKLLKPAEREAAAAVIAETACCWAVGSADNREIDRIGVLPATRLAMQRALESLSRRPEFLLIDYVNLTRQLIPQLSIAKGDMLSFSIAAASIMAKVERDHWMESVCAEAYPQYGFEKHKGYGTALHADCIDQFGPCEYHRMTFHPLAKELKLF